MWSELLSEAQAVVVIWTSPTVFSCDELTLLKITQPLSATDAKPEIYFPRDFLVRLDPNDVKSGSKSGGKKN